MNLHLNSIRKAEGFEDKEINGWSGCTCNEKDCDQMFFQKSTILHVLKPYFEKWKDLPLDITLTSLKFNGFMHINLEIIQTDKISKEQIEAIKEDGS